MALGIAVTQLEGSGRDVIEKKEARQARLARAGKPPPML